MIFRDATPDDTPAVARLGARSFFETFGHLYDPADVGLFFQKHSFAQWRAELSDPAFAVRIGEEDDVLGGYAKLGPPTLPFTARGPAIELCAFYFLAPFHGTGDAATMMDWVLAEARRRGAEHLYLSVFSDNHRARRFYARYGFVEEGPYQYMVGNQADEDIIMRLDL